MKNANQAALAALQVLVVSGGLPHAVDQTVIAMSPKAETQKVLNQLSLASIEKSWLAIPRICKAVGFNAQPMPMTASERSSAISSLYATFVG